MKPENNYGKTFTQDEAFAAAMDIIKRPLEEQVDFLHRFHQHTYTAEEIAGFARAFSDEDPDDYDLPDGEALGIAGTGGDRLGTFNISTAASFVLAASEANVVKYGNKAVTSTSGSVDVLKELDIHLCPGPSEASTMLHKTSLAFLSAGYNPLFRKVSAARKQLGHPTILNVIGPLTNPLAREYALVGVYDQALLGPVAEAMRMLGHKESAVVHGGGMDELSLHKRNQVMHVSPNRITPSTVDPRDVGMHSGALYRLKAQSPLESALMIIDVLGGAKGPHRGIVLLNAAFASYATTAELGMSLQDHIHELAECIDSGKAYAKLVEVQAYSKRFKSS